MKRAILFSIAILSTQLGGTASFAQEARRAELDRQLESVASQLSRVVADSAVRSALAGDIKRVSKNSVASLNTSLGTIMRNLPDKQSDALFTLMSEAKAAESTMCECGFQVQRLDVSIPVSAHRELMNNSAKIYVVPLPTVDESEVKELTAFVNGEKISLSATEAPRIPTLVVGPAESESLEPGYPLVVSDDEGQEPEGARVVDDYVGVARIWIDDDHEPWYKGDPEIYVRVIRFRFNPFGVLNHRHNLPGVNGEQVWYNIGDPNGTYRYVSRSNYSPTVQIRVFEEDGPDSDDHLGTRTITWTGLPFGGYTTFTNGDMRIRVDRD